jgi:hypothetical protein
VTGRWRVEHHTDRRGASLWKVHDGQDRGRPVAEFRDEEAAHAHVERLAEGPFDWDEQEAWQDEDEDEDDDRDPGAAP